MFNLSESKEKKQVVVYTETLKEWKMGQSMHLAIYENDELIPLNFGYGVLFAPADYDNKSCFRCGATRALVNPWLFRMMDGTIGVVAQSMEGRLHNDQEVSVPASPGQLLFWRTTDLVSYHFEGLINISVEETITKPQIIIENGLYHLTWESDNGVIMECSTFDFEIFTAPSVSERVSEMMTAKITGGIVSCEFPLNAQEYRYLLKKLKEVKNIGVLPLADLKLKVGEVFRYEALPRLTALYGDTSMADKAVDWDKDLFSSIDFNTPGTYTLTGKVRVKEYAWPLIGNRADPDIIGYKDKYYFIATDENLQEHLYLRSADTLEGLAAAPDHLILDRNQNGDLSGLFWAPELHVINGKLHILFAGSTESAPMDWWKHVQCRVMELTGNDPTRPEDWGRAQRVMKKDGVTPLLGSTGITLDMTYFELNGAHYYMWSQREIQGGIDCANLMIASMDPADPGRITSEPVLLTKPQFGWDRQGEVNEGPYMIKHNDDVFITFSGSNTDNTYAVGLMAAKADADLLNPECWKVTGYPVLASDHVSGQLGPGHNGFTLDEDGNDVLVFHSRPDGGSRSAGLRTVHWAFDGTPILYMTPERELKQDFRQVTLNIHIS